MKPTQSIKPFIIGIIASISIIMVLFLNSFDNTLLFIIEILFGMLALSMIGYGIFIWKVLEKESSFLRNPHTNLQTKYELFHKVPRAVWLEKPLFYLEIDNFQDIIEVCGPSYSPMIESMVTNKLNEFVPRANIYEIKETTYLLLDVNETKAREVLSLFDQPMRGHEGYETYQLHPKGVCIHPETIHGRSIQEIVTILEYGIQSIRRTQNNLFLIDSAFIQAIDQEAYYQAHLEVALRDGDLTSYFQPKYDPKTKRIISVEALSRWIDKEKIISPSKYIYIAEATGMIHDLDLVAFEQSCQLLNELKELNLLEEDFYISFNLSSITLQNLDANIILNRLKELNLDPKYIHIEITETVALNIKKVQPILNKLHTNGIKIEIDDFSAGNSSLTVLPVLHASTVKLDRAILPIKINDNMNDVIIYKGLVTLMKQLEFQLVAEGVETTEQESFVQSLGIDLIQGYILSKPIPKDQCIDLIKSHNKGK